MKLMLEVIRNDGPGRAYLVNVVRVYDNENEDLLDVGDAATVEQGIAYALGSLQEMLKNGELDVSFEVLSECEHAYRMDAASATGMYDRD